MGEENMTELSIPCPQCRELIEMLMDAVDQGAYVFDEPCIVDHAHISTWEYTLDWLEQRGFAKRLSGRRYLLLWTKL